MPTLVVAEVAHLLGSRLTARAEVSFLGELAAGTYLTESVRASDWIRIAELVARYDDLPLGTVDGSLVAAAERLDVAEVASLDRRHFSVVRPSHVEAFTLLP